MSVEATFAPRRAPWTAGGLACLLLAALVGRLSYGIDRVRDLPWGDDASYETTGVRLLHAFRVHAPREWPTADWAPLYDAYYGLLAIVCPDRMQLFDVTWASLVAGVTFALYAIARCLAQPPPIALVIAAVPLTTNLFHIQPYPSLFALMVVLAGTRAALALPDGWPRQVAVVGTFALASFARPELAVGACVGAAWMAAHALLAWRRRAGAAGAAGLAWAPGAADTAGASEGAPIPRGAAIVAWLSLVPGFALLVTLGSPLGGGRSFEAFAQHYAFVRARSEHLTLDPWMSSERLVHRDFGDATRLSEAARRNPGAFARHVAHTLSELPGNVLDACALRREVTSQASVPWLAVSAVLAVLCILLLAWCLRRAMVTRQDGPRRLVLFTFGLTAISAAPGVVLVFPRAHYLMPVCILGWLVVASWPFARTAPLLRALAHRGAVSVLAAAVFLFFLVPTPASSVPAPMPVRKGALALRALKLGHEPIFEAAYGFTTFAGAEAPVEYGSTKRAPLATILARDRIGALVLAESFLQLASFASDPDVAAFLAAPTRAGFCLTYTDPGALHLYARPSDIGNDAQRRSCEAALMSSEPPPSP